MTPNRDNKMEGFDTKLDELLSSRPVRVRADFLESLRSQVDPDSFQSDSRIEKLLSVNPVSARGDFLRSLKARLMPEQNEERKVIYFPVWVRNFAAVAAIAAISATIWLNRDTVPHEESVRVTVTDEAPLTLDDLFQSQDPELTRILALADNLQPGQNLQNLDKGIESMLVFMD